MRQSASRSLLPLLVLALLLSSAWPSFGQDASTQMRSVDASEPSQFAQPTQATEKWHVVQDADRERSLPAPAPQPSAAPAAVITQGTLRYLPLVVSPPRVTIIFADNADLSNPGTVFAYGIAKLHFRITFEGAQGWKWHREWVINGAHVPGLDRSGDPISDSPFAIDSNIAYCDPSHNCEPLPIGTYQLNVYLCPAALACSSSNQGQLFATSTATIQ
jgi:hypothetical protein